jgi:hypothetical protein
MPCALCGNPKTPKGEPLCNLHRKRVNDDLEAMLKEHDGKR